MDDGWDSLDEKISNAEEKKHGFKDLIKKRLRRRRLTGSVHQKKDSPNAEPKVEPMQKDVKPELPKLKDSENSHHSSTKSKLPKHEVSLRFLWFELPLKLYLYTIWAKLEIVKL